MNFIYFLLLGFTIMKAGYSVEDSKNLIFPNSSDCGREYHMTCFSRPQAGKPIPSGYISFLPVGHYKYHEVPLTWNEARKTCSLEGSHLAVLNSEAEARLLASIIPGDKIAWIGVHDFFQDGEWMTIFDQTTGSAGFNKWVPNEPNGGTNENCGVITKSDGKMGSYFCPKELTFICELD